MVLQGYLSILFAKFSVNRVCARRLAHKMPLGSVFRFRATHGSKPAAVNIPNVWHPASKLPPLALRAPSMALFNLIHRALHGVTFQHEPSGSWMAIMPPARNRRSISSRMRSGWPVGANKNWRCTGSNRPEGSPVAADPSTITTLATSAVSTNVRAAIGAAISRPSIAATPCRFRRDAVGFRNHGVEEFCLSSRQR